MAGGLWQERVRRIAGRIGLLRLEPRERWVLAGGLLFLLLFFFWQFLLEPFFAARDHLAQAVARKEHDLVMMRELQQKYREQRESAGELTARLAARDPGFTLFTFVDRQAERAGVKRQISSIKPMSGEGDGPVKETSVEVKLQGVGLAGLVEFLLLVEAREAVVFVRRLALQESGVNSGLLEATLQIATYVGK
jgi:general secretion pathway protein M